MTLASFIDIILTPIGGGVGAALALFWVGKQNPERKTPFSSLGAKIGVGGAVALVLFVLKIV